MSARPDLLDVLPYADTCDDDGTKLPFGQRFTLGRPTVAEQLAAGCADGHNPASATGVCTRCGYDVMGYYADPCPRCGAGDYDPCAPGCGGASC